MLLFTLTLLHALAWATNAKIISAPRAADRIVLPFVDDTVNRDSPSELTPSTCAKLQYAEPNGPYVMTVSANLTSPAVILENSNCVAIESCNADAGELVLGFSSQECYDIAVQTWSVDMVLITNRAGCNPDNERGLYQAFEYDYRGFVGGSPKKSKCRMSRLFPLHVSIRVRPVTLKDVASLMEIEYGQRSTGESAATMYTQTVTSSWSHPVKGLTSTVFTIVRSATLASTVMTYSSEGWSSPTGGPTSSGFTSSARVSSSGQRSGSSSRAGSAMTSFAISPTRAASAPTFSSSAASDSRISSSVVPGIATSSSAIGSRISSGVSSSPMLSSFSVGSSSTLFSSPSSPVLFSSSSVEFLSSSPSSLPSSSHFVVSTSAVTSHVSSSNSPATETHSTLSSSADPSSSRTSSASSSSASVIWDRSIYDRLVAGITINNDTNSTNLVLRPVFQVNVTAGMEPLRLDDADYQTSLQADFTADGVDSSEKMTLDSIDALNAFDDTISNVTEILGVTLEPGSILQDITFDDDPSVNATLLKRNLALVEAEHKMPAGTRTPESGSHHQAYDLSKMAIRDPHLPARHLNKRDDDDGWDTFFDIMGDDFIGEICEICGAISAGRDLYNAAKCLFGFGCPAPPQVTALEGTFTQISTISVAYSPNALIFVDRGTRVNCVKCGITVSSLKIEGKVVIIPSQNAVVSAVVTVSQSSVSDLFYNIFTPGAYNGGFDIAASSLQLDSLTAPGVVTMAPKFLYGLGLKVTTNAALNVQAGASLTINDGRARFDVKGQSGENQKSWQPSGVVTYPQFSKPGRVVLTPYMKTDVQISLTIFGKLTKNAIAMVSQTNLAFDAQVLTTTVNIKKRDGEGSPTKIERQVPALFAGVKPGPICAAHSLRVTANMRTMSAARVVSKSVQLFDQNYRFGSRCVFFPPPPAPISSSTSRSSAQLTPTSSVSPAIASDPPVPIMPTYPTCVNCGPICVNGEFEYGIQGWNRMDTTAATLRFPIGGVPTTSRYLEADISPGKFVDLSTDLRTVAGQNYTVKLDYQFSATKTDCYINGFYNSAYIFSVSTRFNAASVNAWATEAVPGSFTATGCASTIRVVFSCFGSQSVTMRLDNLKFTQAPAARPATCPAS